ncbi:MAG: hypothetical protein ACRCYN_01875, partial [Plesiomonas sp.]
EQGDIRQVYCAQAREINLILNILQIFMVLHRGLLLSYRHIYSGDLVMIMASVMALFSGAALHP